MTGQMWRGLAVAVTLLAGVPVQAQNLEDAVAEDYGYLFDLYTFLHAHPELSFQEKETMARVAAELSGLGFDVTQNVGGYGLVGVLENGSGPTVLIRTDLDALPLEEKTELPYASTVTATEQTGQDVHVMHACGHDIHMTVFVGTARRLAALKDRWRGTVVMIGQPAEERGAGARAMLADGLFTHFPQPDYNLALHVQPDLASGKVALGGGYKFANVDSVDIHVKGVGGHGAYPHTAKDPIVLAARIVTALQTVVAREIDPQKPAVVTVGAFNAGAKHNVIPDGAHLQLTVRSYADDVREKLLAAIERIAVNEGRVAGLPEDLLPVVEVKDEFTPSAYNHPELAERARTAMEAELGAQNVVDQVAVMGGEDFGQYGRTAARIPSLLYRLGAVPESQIAAAEAGDISLPSLHSPFFAPQPEPTITTGVRAMTAAALELLEKW